MSQVPFSHNILESTSRAAVMAKVNTAHFMNVIRGQSDGAHWLHYVISPLPGGRERLCAVTQSHSKGTGTDSHCILEDNFDSPELLFPPKKAV